MSLAITEGDHHDIAAGWYSVAVSGDGLPAGLEAHVPVGRGCCGWLAVCHDAIDHVGLVVYDAESGEPSAADLGCHAGLHVSREAIEWVERDLREHRREA